MGPGDPYYDFFGQHATGPFPLCEGDDVAAARNTLEAAGIEIVGPPGRDSNWEWVQFRAPDGNLYDVNAELTSRLIYGGTEESTFYALTLRQIGPRLIGAGLLDPDDADQIGAFAQDPASRWLSLAMVTAWGWRP